MTEIPQSFAAIRDWLGRELCSRLGVSASDFDPRRPFLDYGLDSIAATRLIADLGKALDRDLRATLAWEHPTADSLARALDASSTTKESGAPAFRSASDRREPIAVIGMACRFPGAQNPAAFWDLLRDGVDAVTEVPPERWDSAAWHDPNPSAPGKMVTRRGGFIKDADRFDAEFFGISPREAAQMDPQQRLMLELSWESLDDAGLPADSLRGSRTGVFFGAVWRDYSELQAMEGAIPTPHTAAGHAGSIIANRVSYALGLQGPSLAIDAACSSSLVAVHLACQSLRSGECKVALAGGVLLLLSPRTSVNVSAFGGLSPDGMCRTFDAGANGYVRGEGAGVVVLKPLSQALADGDPICCLLRGSAVNNDGATNGLTAPGILAQTDVIREAWASAGIDPSEAAFSELHGTGTPLGDPIEARALSAVLCANRPPEQPLAVGSVKTNIGHSEAAAGIAGLIKVALALRHRAIPPSLHFDAPNPHIDFEALRIRVQTGLSPLPDTGRAAVAGVSSFGFGGTNCHVVMEEFRETPLGRLSGGRDGASPKLAFVFCGGGLAWPEMARELIREPAFRTALTECDRVLRQVAGWSLLEELIGSPAPRLHLLEVELPALFSVQIALARLWRAQGIEPDAVLGHSVGEWAAAHVAGALSVENGIRLACAYARALQPLAGSTAMGVVGLPRERTASLLEEYGGRIAIAADNGPASTGIGGDRRAIEELAVRLQRDGIFCRTVDVDGCAHIPAVDPLMDGFAAECGSLHGGPLLVPMLSTVTGDWLQPGEADGAYWVRNFREPVLFSQAAAALLGSGHTVFLEVSPHPAHARDLRAIAAAAGVPVEVLPSLQRGMPGPKVLMDSRAALQTMGVMHRPETRPELLVLSARSPAALRQMAAELEVESDARFEDICYTAAVRRSHHDYRLAVVARSLAECTEMLPRLAAATLRRAGPPRVAFVFSDEGVPSHNAMRQLLASEPVFRETMERCDIALRRSTSWPENSRVSRSLLFAVHVSLAALWRDWGVNPDVVEGSGVGEISAAHVAGQLSLDDAAGIVAEGGRIAPSTGGHGDAKVIEIGPGTVDRALMLETLGRLYTAGAAIAWDRVFARDVHVVRLPSYPWQRQRHWFERRDRGTRTFEIAESNAGPLADHRVYGTLVVPGASHIARLLSVAREVFGATACTLEDVTFPHALSIPTGESRTVHITIEPEQANGAFARVASREGTHASGRLVRCSERPAIVDRGEIEQRCTAESSSTELYAALREQGLDLGPCFQWVKLAWAGESEILGRMRLAGPGDRVEESALPAGLVDSCFQLLGLLLERRASVAFVPFNLDSFRYFGAPATPTWCHLVLRRNSGDMSTADLRLFDDAGRVIAEATGFTVTRAPRSLLLGSDDLLYEPRWSPAPLAAAERPLSGRWLILSNRDCGAAAELAGALRCDVVYPGDPLPSVCEYEGVVYLRALDAPPFAHRLVCGGALELVQWLARSNPATPPRLWLVTRSAQADVTQAPLWGLANAIRAEHPEWKCAVVDLDDGGTGGILAEMRGGDFADRVAWRNGSRYTSSLERRPAGTVSALELKDDASYLITGGLGALGLQVAGWMVDRGARNLVLLGRHAPAAQAASAIRELERRGAQVSVESCDVRNAAELESVLVRIRQTGKALRGVIHAAGVLEDGVLVNQDWERFWRAMSPKVEGAWNLHTLTARDELDFFVLFSSVASVMSAPGQGNYAAGNAFLDALAHHRRAQGLRAISINWGPWSGSGMAEQLGPAYRSLVPLAPVEALRAMGELLSSGSAQCVVVRQEKRERAAAAKTVHATSRQAIEQHLRASVASLLGLSSGQSLDSGRPLRDLGFDSMMALDLRDELGVLVGRTLPATLAFDYPTLATLADYLVGETAAEERREVAAAGAIAIVGMACRFPGADNVETYWRNLHEGVDAISEVPRDRWNVDAYFDENRDAPGKTYSRWGGFLSQIDGFDAGFFGIAPREARGMDPQQRILLEVTWEALESAGLPTAKLAGTETGVFLGFCLSDYAQKQLYASDASGIDAYSGTGSVGSVAAGRLSYFLGLQGPSMAIDTACSSSLVSVHLACQSLRAGECDVALAGGVNLLLSPNLTVYFAKLTALAPDGRCKAFDAAANGYVRGEGCGMLVLKPLDKAMADGDNVLAVIRGSAVNQDGRSNGLTAPSGLAQERVIRGALRQGGVDARAIEYVEAHGTGTPLGDPIEIGALAAALCKDRPSAKKLFVGSVKTNIGHLEGAAGVASLIKVVLALRHREIPPHLHLKEKSPHVPWQDLPIEVPTAPLPWTGAGRLAGVSSFGFSGTNAHIVLQEAPETHAPADDDASRCHVVVLSAKSPQALDAVVDAWRALPPAESSLRDLAYTSTVRRTHHEYRLAASARSVDGLRVALSAHRAGETSPFISTGQAIPGTRPRVVFVFSGHGSQWFGMGRTLLQEEPVFRAEIERCAKALGPYVDWTLAEQLSEPSGQARLSESDVAQPAIFAMQVALAALWRSWGVEPEAVVGHSSGEIAAAHIAGALTLDEAAGIVCHRSRLVQAAAGHGAMLAVEATQDDVEFLIAGRPLWVAAINSPTALVLSGNTEGIEETGRELAARGIYCRRVDVDYASHCPLMDPFRDELVRALNGLTPRKPKIPIYSTVTGRLAANGDFGAEYWGRHLRQPVSFRPSIDALLDAGFNTFLSVDSHPVLAHALTQCIEARGSKGEVMASLHRDQDAGMDARATLGRLFALGYPVDWERHFAEKPKPVPLPAYPWEHQRYWIDESAPAPREGRHSLLGRRVRSALRNITFETELSPRLLPYLEDHRAYGTLVVAGASHLAMVCCAGRELLKQDRFRIDAVSFPEALALSEEAPCIVQLVLTPGDGGSHAFEVLSQHGEDWTLHASGVLRPDAAGGTPVSLDGLRSRCPREIPASGFYETMREQGVQYGSAFRWIERLWQGEREALCRLRVPESEQTAPYVLHPGLIDSCFQLLRAVPALQQSAGAAVVPVAVDSFRVLSAPKAPTVLWAHFMLESTSGDDTFAGDMILFDAQGDVVAEARGLTAKRAPRELFLRSAPHRDWLYEVQWTAAPARPERHPRSWVIVPDRGGLGEAVVRRLEGLGMRARLAGDASGEPPEGVVYLRAMGDFESDCEAAQQQICSAVPELLRTLHGGTRLWLVTRGSQAIGSSPISFQQASLWGLGHALAEEHPELHCVRLDLDPAGNAIDDLVEELTHADGEDRVAWRGGRRYAARLVRRAGAPLVAPKLRVDGTYLITGGLGALGLATARWLTQHGAGHVVLMGRSKGAVVAEQGDVANRTDVERVLERIRAGHPPLRGIVHAAGVLDDALLDQTSWERFYGVMRPKLQGAWNLHELTAGDPLDFFVFFSSATAVVGSAGQASHAAANAGLDALAHYRRANGLPAVTLNWGPWAEIGQAAAEAHRGQRLAALGIGSIPPARGLDIFGELLCGEAIQTIVLPVDWDRWSRANTGSGASFFSALSKAPGPSESTREAIQRAAPESRRELLTEAISRDARRVLQLNGAPIDIRRPLLQFGLDSLMALELRRRIDRQVGASLPLARILGGATIEELAGLAADALGASADWVELEL